MVEMKIDASELKGEGSELIKQLADFLKGKTGAEVRTESNNVIVEGETVSKKYLRVLLKKFLHRSELKESFRIIGGRENSLIIKEKKIYEEE